MNTNVNFQRCGSALFDDFFEKCPGAARDLQEYLNQEFIETTSGSQSTASQIELQSGRGSTFDASRETQAPGFSFTEPQNQQELYDPSPRRRRDISTVVQCDPETHWLLVCAGGMNRPTSLSQLNICVSTSDKMLFRKLRGVYLGLRSRWSTWFSLRTVRSIKFVQV